MLRVMLYLSIVMVSIRKKHKGMFSVAAL